MPIISDAIKYSRLALGLRGFLSGTITLEESKQVIADRLHDREKNFLSLVQKGIYQNPKSPFLKLLKLAGCEYGDIEPLVNKGGVEAALKKLLADGVYLSWEEFKGRKEVVRGGQHFSFSERDFDNPFLAVYYQAQSSGSRSTGTRTTFDLNRQVDVSYYRLLMLADHDALDIPIGLWKPILPAPSGISNVLNHWKMGKPIDRWFSPVNERQVQASLTYRLAMRYIIYGSRLWGARLARPEYVGLEEAVKVARWVAETKRRYGGCSFDSYVSPAVKLCQAAIENGLDIAGTKFFVGGEPLTPAKRQQIEATGASVTPKYSISEIGKIGCGCSQAGATDDIHLFSDSMAAIQRRRRVEPTNIDVDAFLFTPLLPSTPKILLNAESDDYGAMETKSCDCLFGQLGLNTHIHDIRSFAKLTGSGMALIGTDLVRALEEVLPGKYGGTAPDYQLLEEEDSQGQTHLSLIISPEVGVVDEDDAIATVLRELRRIPHPGKLTAGVWSGARILRVKRMQPISIMGKVMILHLMKTA
jgi:hypothetical protein